MGRLRQYNANRYSSSDAVQAEFEQVIRYINAAELGNQTLAELLQKLFTDDGNVNLGIRFRYDAVTGLEVSTGDDDDNWTPVIAADDIRGAPGESLGMIDGPVYFNRVDIVATAAQQVFPYTIHADAADVLVFCNGVLQAANSYTYSAVANTVTLAVGQSAGVVVTIYSIRNNSSSTYRRADIASGASQVIFPFPHTDDEYVQVFRNGLLQREGASYDYIKSSATGTITMTTAQSSGTIITAMVVQNSAIRDVLGLMLEDRYATDGLIRYDRIAIADGQVPQAKVSGLVAALALKGDTYVQTSAPTGTIRQGSLWVNTAGAVPVLLFYDGARWLNPNPASLLQAPTSSDALKYLRYNSTATALEAVSLDFSGLVAASAVGNPGGVASLDSSALVPNSQLPVINRRTILQGRLETVANGTKNVAVIGGQKYSFDGATYVLDAGTATVQLRINGVDFGTAQAVTTAASRVTWSAAVADALAAGLPVSLVITLATGASGLVWSVQGTILQ